jgi:hypothetical protein
LLSLISWIKQSLLCLPAGRPELAYV